MSLKSKVSIARPGSPSLRATIPEGIVAFMNLKEGDIVYWKMEIADNKRIVVVEKLAPVLDEGTIKTAANYAKKKVVT
jgi:bifunctional DNA-binding transcriptional regulator/antitoxin component of YhaV-PrlF toxin-antitoxin module